MKALLATAIAIAGLLVASAGGAPRSDAGGDAAGVAPAAGADAKRPDGLLVIAALGPERAIVADPRTGRTAARVFPGGTLCHGPILTVGDSFAFAAEEDGRAVLEAVPLERPHARPRTLGPAGHALASATPGRVWVGVRHRRGTIALREVDATGRTHARRTAPLTEWEAVVADTQAGFLTTRDRGLVLNGERIRRGWLLAAGAHRFAHCPGRCATVHVGDATFEAPAGLRPTPGPRSAFSPDGAKLALPAEDGRAAVLDLRTGRWTAVRGVRLGVYGALAWSPSGRWLYLAARDGRVLAARDGTGRPRSLPIRVRGEAMSISTAGSAAR